MERRSAMSRFCGELDVSAVLDAGQHWRNSALRGDASVLGGERIWTLANLQELDNRFTNNPDETDRSFVDKLHDQLANSSAHVKQLAAEIMWLLLLCPSNISADRKRSNIRKIWDWSNTTLSRNQPMAA